MEDKQHEFVLILAGYSKEMDNFLSLNPGLHSRFPIIVNFPDYSVDELMEIAYHMLVKKEYTLSHDAEQKLRDHLFIVKQSMNPRAFSNGRYVRNIIEKSIRAQSMRLLMHEMYEKKDLMTLRSQDIMLDEKT